MVRPRAIVGRDAQDLAAGLSAEKSPKLQLSVQCAGRRSSPVLDLNDFFYFVQVVDRGGFTAAGRTLTVNQAITSPASCVAASRDST